MAIFWTFANHKVGLFYEFQPISGEHRDQPRLAVFLVRDDRRLVAAVVDRLFDRVEDVEILNALHFEMERRQFRANHVGVPRGTAVLLAAECLQESGLAELIPPKPFDALSFLPGVHCSMVETSFISRFQTHFRIR